jgi:two-component system CheB/CheR fusion protein
MANAEHEVSVLQRACDLLLRTMEPAVIVLDNRQIVTAVSESAHRMWRLPEGLVGRSFENCGLMENCRPLLKNLRESLAQNTAVIQFKHTKDIDRAIQFNIRPVWSADHDSRLGTLIYMADATPHETQQSIHEALRSTQEALQIAYEELETANEQLQMTNEELEAGNEELQSTNEELQSLNEELETTNEQLVSRASEFEVVNLSYREVLKRIPWPVFLVNDDLTISFWTISAQQLFGLHSKDTDGLRLFDVPFSDEVREMLTRRSDVVMKTNKGSILHNQLVGYNGRSALYDVHLEPVTNKDLKPGVLLIFEKLRTMTGGSSAGPRIATSVRVKAKGK